uniref:Ig-like domain-containing protein n=1 Tax=Pavo cristatus TaxID=9049 RepID=A0A8C9FDH3_PAVCR
LQMWLEAAGVSTQCIPSGECKTDHGHINFSGSLLLTCTVKGAPLDSPYYDWNCVRLSPGGELQFLGWIYPFGNNTGYAPSFQDRASISADKAKNKVSLQLHALRATDRATYFCARQHTVKPREGVTTQKVRRLLW